jgi:hypothetical protein
MIINILGLQGRGCVVDASRRTVNSVRPLAVEAAKPACAQKTGSVVSKGKLV